jgi:WD40 repeat protein
MVPSTVSIVDPTEMVELARTTTGIMPHGGRFSNDGLRHYSVSMMDGKLFEMDALTFDVLRTLTLKTALSVDDASADDASVDRVRDADTTDAAADGRGQTVDSAGGHEHSSPPIHKPTWAAPHPSAPFVYVAANGSAQVVEVNVESWQIERVFRTPPGPYNIDVSPDGKWMVVTYKGAQSTGIWSLESGKEVAVIRNTRPIPHGVAITDDSRFAFVTVEGIGAEPGAVDMVDLISLELKATVDVGKQAGGVAFWKQVPQAIAW